MSLGSVDITYEISETSIAFLDVVFCISGDRITSCIYYKPTDSHSYLRYDSHHPKACRDNIPFSQFLRLRRNCSGDADFNRESSRMAQFFADRGYPPEIVNRARIRASAIERQESLRSRESVTSSKIPLVLPYNQIHCKISGIIHRNSKILSEDPEIGAIFSGNIITAYKRTTNLRDSLVHSGLPQVELPGSFPCGKPRCVTCPHIRNDTVIVCPSQEIILMYL